MEIGQGLQHSFTHCSNLLFTQPATQHTETHRFYMNISHFYITSYDESTGLKVEFHESPHIKGNDKECKVQNNNSHVAE